MTATGEDGIRAAVAAWLQAAVSDAERRGLPELRPLLESLAESTIAIRKADWNDVVPHGKAGGVKAEGGDAGVPAEGRTGEGGKATADRADAQ